jgi:L,D-peptidoglycan transpeptidase YkuD (ErfK/YbiS/YcfS/YnhG family)
MMPLPGGIYSVGDIQWAKKDDYQASLGAGLGPMFVPVEPQFQTRRSAFGIHADTGAYGTAGCIGVRSTDDLKRLVRALREYDPKRLVVDWS